MKIENLAKLMLTALVSSLLYACDSDESEKNRVSLGTSNTLFSLAELQYQEQFVVQVTDLNGDPSPNTSVSFRLQPLSYNKGFYVPTDTDIPADGEADSWTPLIQVTCNSEDSNNNGVLDAGEDVNSNSKLEPAVPAITAHPEEVPTILPGRSSLITDDNGFGYLAVTYPKSESSWARIRLSAEARDGSPGNIATYSWTLRSLLSDLSDLTIDPPGGVGSPYGTAADCTDPD